MSLSPAGNQTRAVAKGGPHPAREYQPSTGAVKGSKILWPGHLCTQTSRIYAELAHGQSILKVLRTKPLTAPAPGSDRRLSGEAHQVGGHPPGTGGRHDHHAQAAVADLSQRSLPHMPGRRPSPRSRM